MDEYEALALAAAAKKRKAAQQTNMRDQIGSGLNEGLANIAGAPVDIATMAINSGVRGVNALAGTEIPTIDSPAGGSQTFRAGLDPLISDVEPQTTAQRYARSISREGAEMAVPTLGMAAKAQKPMQVLALGAGSAAGSGAAGQAAEDLGAPPSVRAIAEILGGMSPVGASRTVRPSPSAPSMDALKAEQASAYRDVENANATITPASRDRLVAALGGRAQASDMDQYLHPRAYRTVDRMEALPRAPTIYEVEQKRRLVGRDVAGSADPSEREIGVNLKNEIDDYLKSLSPQDVTGPDAAAAVDALGRGRNVTRRIKNSELIESLVGKGERRAATSGTGGNMVNAIRQNLRTILDDPKKRRGFSQQELEQIEAIVRGDVTTNSLRLLGRLAPTSGALPLAGNVGGLAASGGDPLMLAAMAASSAAKGGAEMLTSRRVEQLAELVRNGAPLDAKRLSDAERRVVQALMAQQAATSAAPQ